MYRKMRSLIRKTVLWLPMIWLLPAGAGFADTTDVMIVLDASGSMAERIEGRSKLDIAKESILKVLDTLPPQVRVGLRVYGHQSPRELHDCMDSRLELPLDFVDINRFRDVLNRLVPRGYTPLAYSLDATRSDFIGGDNNVIICLTDGVETCDGDPCVVADSLRASAFKVRIHVVGFRIGEIDRQILMCIPRNSDGQYFSADRAHELGEALQDAFELSVNPGYLKLSHSGLANRSEIIRAELFTPDNRYLFKRANNAIRTALPPGYYKLAHFTIWADLDLDPYCPLKTALDSIRITGGEETVVPLDPFSVVRADFTFPPDSTLKAVLSFHHHKKAVTIPDLEITSTPKFLLLAPGQNSFRTRVIANGKPKSKVITVELLPQGYHEIRFDFQEMNFMVIVLPLLGIAAIVTYLWALKRQKNRITPAEEFAKDPSKFRNQNLTLELRLSEQDKGINKEVSFWTFYPVKLNVMIFVPSRFRSLVEFDTRYKIRVTFRCRAGSAEKGNILVEYKRGSKI